ncbi:MAG TPA: hypothetical protein VFM55_08455 [Micromonosporaceae bacterium]|nr:hypothetical protein [Micromonosporaceae bacterium]
MGPVRAVSGRTLELIRSAGLTGLVRQASDYAVRAPGGDNHAGAAGGDDRTGAVGATDRVLPVVPELRPLLPAGGLRRGTTVAVATGVGEPSDEPPGPAGAGLGGTGATSVLLTLLAAASRSGSWCAVVGIPALGAVAAAEAGIELSRLALVPSPGPDWSRVVAALLDGVDIVVAAPPGPVAAVVASRLAARARQRGAVLVLYGWWDSAHVVLRASGGRWEGLGPGRGRLRCRQLTVVAVGRGAAARRREAHLWLPAGQGGAAPAGSPPGRLRAPVRHGS